MFCPQTIHYGITDLIVNFEVPSAITTLWDYRPHYILWCSVFSHYVTRLLTWLCTLMFCLWALHYKITDLIVYFDVLSADGTLRDYWPDCVLCCSVCGHCITRLLTWLCTLMFCLRALHYKVTDLIVYFDVLSVGTTLQDYWTDCVLWTSVCGHYITRLLTWLCTLIFCLRTIHYEITDLIIYFDVLSTVAAGGDCWPAGQDPSDGDCTVCLVRLWLRCSRHSEVRQRTATEEAGGGQPQRTGASTRSTLTPTFQ